MGGAEEAHRALPNEALYGVLRILGLINPAYLQISLLCCKPSDMCSRRCQFKTDMLDG